MKMCKDKQNGILLRIAGFAFILHYYRKFSDHCFSRYGYRWLQEFWVQHVVGWPEVLQRSYVQQGKDFGLDVQTPLVTVPVVLEDGCSNLHSQNALNANREGGK